MAKARFTDEDDVAFVVMAKNFLPTLLDELQEAQAALAEMRRLFGADWRAGVKQFEKVVEEV